MADKARMSNYKMSKNKECRKFSSLEKLQVSRNQKVEKLLIEDEDVFFKIRKFEMAKDKMSNV